MAARDIKIINTGAVPESSSFFESRADSVVSIGTNMDGNEIITFVFMDNYPVVGQVDGELTITSIEKRKVAAITLGQGNAKKFYESLKKIFEDQ